MGLAGLNVVLACVVLARWTSGEAGAQGAVRARGEYTLASGRIAQGGNHAVYVLDGANQDMVAVRWDQARQTLVGVGYRSIAQDALAQPGR